jgi:aldehyde dehydrogenase (NAD+)
VPTALTLPLADTIYGLNNAVGSADVQRALTVAGKLKSGTVMINGTDGSMTAAFGGYKQSGNAREWGKYGIEVRGYRSR